MRNKKIEKNKQIKLEPAKREYERTLQKQIDKAQAQLEHDLEIQRYAEREFERAPLTEVPDEVKLPTDYFEEVQKKVEYNQVYADHYMRKFENTNLRKYEKLSENVRNCHKSWFGDHYKKTGYFNVKRVYHCHNRWCWLCNHLKQAKRLYEYHLRFEELLKSYDLYHVVFTVPNCPGNNLKYVLERMQKGLKKIIRYFQGFGKLDGFYFSEYGFVGAIRSFEIVINPTDYHPHLHCLFLLKKGLEFPKTEINKYSFSYGSAVPVRKFSKFEIFLQKLFFLTANGQKVNAHNIQSLPIGYSCIVDFVEGDAWHEVFKYATKMSKDGSSTCTYEQFCLLDDILHRFKMLQGYGIFYDMEDPEPDADPSAEILFEKVLILLNRIESPDRDISVALDKLVDELHRKKLTVISKNLSYKYLQTIVEDLKKELCLGSDYEEPF